MSDENTSKIAIGDTQPTRDNSTQELIRQLMRRINDLTELLRSQAEILKQRGMNLPSGSLDSLRTLKMRLDGLSRQLLTTQLELRRLRGLADTTALINSALDTNVVLEQVMDTVISLTGAERGYIVMKDRESGAFNQFRVARGVDREQLVTGVDSSGRRSDVSTTIVNEVASSGKPVLTDNASDDPRFAEQKSVMTHGLRSILAVPLQVRNDIIGVVYCDNKIIRGLFQEHERDLLAAFANQAAVAIENARLFESARERLGQLTQMRDLLDNIFDSITSAVLTANYNGVVTIANATALQILNIEKAEGFKLGDILPPLGDEFFQALEQVLADGVQQVLEVQPVLDGLGQRYWNVIVSALRDASGKRQGLALVIDDLTEQKEREATLAEVRRYLPMALMDNIRSVDDVTAGQERVITAIATDVRGFTTFSQYLAPEVLMEIINKYLAVASDAINLYEGIVDKYMGDAVTGLFNTQLNPQEDHAVRAVRAAMSIIYDLYALHEVLPEDQRLFFGIGIHTGPAFLGNVGSEDRREFSALGDATGVAKILESTAERGEVIISPATYELVKDVFEVEERTPSPDKVKNRADLPVVYRVLKRKKGAVTGQLFIDPELANLLKDLGD